MSKEQKEKRTFQQQLDSENFQVISEKQITIASKAPVTIFVIFYVFPDRQTQLKRLSFWGNNLDSR